MRLMILLIFSYVFVGNVFIKCILAFGDNVRGVIEFRKIKRKEYYAIRLCNMQTDHKEYPKMIFWAIVSTISAVGIFYKVIKEGCGMYILILFTVVLFTAALNLIQAMLVWRFGDECYLSSDGVVAIDKIRKNKCRFTINTELEDGTNEVKYINVYEGKKTYPYRYKIIEKEYEVVQLINAFQAEGKGI